jgi:putative membrane protein
VRGPTPGGGGRGPFGPFGPRRLGHHGGWEWLHALLGLVVVAAIVALIVFLLLRLFERNQAKPVATGPIYPPPPRPAGAPIDPALAELRLRYARGEVSRDDFLPPGRRGGGQ